MIYIHIPYCRSFCTYCGFYSEIPAAGSAACAGGAGRVDEATAMAAFTDALCREIEDRAGEIPWENNTLYIGGGTPSVLPLADLRRVVETLAAARPFEEFTVEVNPDDIVHLGEEYVAGLRELGVNRISMGVQSMDDRVLCWMNRRHDAQTARRAYRLLHDGGINNISVDLIFGLGDMEDRWVKTIDDILNIGGDGVLPKHISAYQLSVEPDSALAEMAADGRYTEASDEMCARQYEILCERLAAAGYRHYEISNFSLPGYEARHNSAYWCHVPYIGFGPAAHSFLQAPDAPGFPVSAGSRKFIRRWNRPDISGYLQAAKTGDWDSISEGEKLTAEQLRTEKIMLALRTDKGIEREFIAPDAKILDQLLASGSLIAVGDRLRIPEDHFFVSDDIISHLI